MPWYTGVQYHYVIANLKYMNKIFKQSSLNASFQVTTDLLNNENLKVTITQLRNELQVCKFTMLWLTQK